jgi:adenylate cyclase
MRLTPAGNPADPDDAAGQRSRLLPPVLLAALLAIAAVGMSYFSFQANQRDALRLTDDTLGLLEERVVAEVTTFLSIPERALSILAEFAGNRAILPHERQAATESATALLRVAQMLALVGFADADGNWLMVRRDPQTGALETKTIAHEGGVRRAFWTRRADAGAEAVREDDPEDRFDPRTRPWWRLAQGSAGVTWTDLYVFFTDRQPGVTAVQALPDGPIAGAVMVDVRLSSLSDFLARLTVGRTGRALILDRDGQLVAIGDPNRRVVVHGNQVEPARIVELNDPVLNRAFDLFRAEGPGRRMVEVAGERYIMMAARLPGEGRNWNLLMVVPQDDFVGFVRRNSLFVLLMAMGVVALAALLALLAIRRTRGAARAEAMVRARDARFEAQAENYATLAASAGVPAILGVAARALGARRAGLWRLTEAGQGLACETQFDAMSGTHGGGISLRRGDAPKLFAALDAGQVLDIADTATDPRTAELSRLYLRPVGTERLLSVPLPANAGDKAGGKAGGWLWIEDAAPDAAVAPLPFARAAAAMLARTLSPAAAATTTAAATDSRRRGAALLALMRDQPQSSATSLRTRVFPRIAVMIIAITEDSAIVAATCADGSTLLARVRQIVLTAVQAGRVPCVRLLGERVLFADGFEDDPEDAVRRLADLALVIQERLTDAFTEAQLGLDFRIGLDLGPAAGTLDPRVATSPSGPNDDWNIFGEAVRAATSLAESAPPAAIQVSDTAHAALSADFLMRARGKFFIPDTGEIGTWLVAGHP